MSEPTPISKLAPSYDDLLSQAARDRVRRYLEKRRALSDKYGEGFAQLWSTAQRFIEQNGRVRLPPSRWEFVPAARLKESGNPAEFTPEQSSQWRDFWDWYLLVESNLTLLIHCIHELYKVRKEHEALFQAVCTAAHPICHQYQDWIRDGRIAWLPRNRGGDLSLNIVQRLGQALIKFDTGPADESPNDRWEPML